jgi:hypothetical protein
MKTRWLNLAYGPCREAPPAPGPGGGVGRCFSQAWYLSYAIERRESLHDAGRRKAPLTLNLAAGVVRLRLKDQILVLLNFLLRPTPPRFVHRSQEGGEEGANRAGVTEKRTEQVLTARV